MELIALAVGAGVVLAVVTGGSLGRVLDVSVRGFGLLVGAVALQLVLGLWHPGSGWPGGLALGLYLTSFALLAAFCAANLHLTGMPIVALGVLANVTVVALNGAMPVRLPTDAGPADEAQLEASATHQPEAEADRLAFLGQVVPLPGPTARTVSFGDLILAIGLVDVLYRASRRPRDRRRRQEPEQGPEQDPGQDPVGAPAGAGAAEDPAGEVEVANLPRSGASGASSGADGEAVAAHDTFERGEDLGVVDVSGR